VGESFKSSGRLGHSGGASSWWYISLWLAICTGDWNLRIAAYKLLGPLFRAYDRTHYQQLIPLHLAHLHQLLPKILDSLQQGLWTVSLKGRPYKNLALNEAHKTLINRDLKMSMNRPPSSASLSLRTNYLNFRSIAFKNFKKQVDCGRRNKPQRPATISVGAH
jgi:hypothetical protein